MQKENHPDLIVKYITMHMPGEKSQSAYQVYETKASSGSICIFVLYRISTVSILKRSSCILEEEAITIILGKETASIVVHLPYSLYQQMDYADGAFIIFTEAVLTAAFSKALCPRKI